MRLWRFNGSVLCTKEKLQVVFAITVRDIFIPVVYYREQLLKKFDCNVWCIVIPVGLSHEILPCPSNTAIPLIQPYFYDPLVTV